MTKYVMIIDPSRCVNCKACMMACQQENQTPLGVCRNWIKAAAEAKTCQRQYLPGNCMQCDHPVCVEACPTRATWKEERDGVVKIDPRLCIGCGSCVRACPYGARFLNPALRAVDKCDYCPRLRTLGYPPACVAVCPTKTRRFGDLEDPSSGLREVLAREPAVRVSPPQSDTKPAIYYLGEAFPVEWPRNAATPAPIRLWRSVLTPAARLLGGLTLLGVAGVALRQRLMRREHAPGEEAHP